MAINFFRLGNVTTGTGPGALGFADLNGDGNLDLVVANAVNNITIYTGNGAGGFSAFRSYVTGATPSGIGFGDVNGDGRTDIIVANSLSNKVTTLLNNGVDFNQPIQRTVGVNPGGLAIGDLNGDGRADAVVANRDTDTVSVMMSVSGRLAVPTMLTLPGRAITTNLADMNGDGLLDIVASSFANVFTFTDTVVSVLLNKGGGAFATPVTSSGSVATIGSQAIDDVNGDGKRDVVVGNTGASFVSVYLGDGTGTLAAPFNTATNGTPSNVTLGDVDRDGKVDLIYTVGSQIVFQAGKGDGTFAPSVFNGFAFNSIGNLAGADLNGDGMPDGIASITANGVINTFLNTSSNTLAGITPVADVISVKEAGGNNNAIAGNDASGNVLSNDTGTGLTVVGVAWLGGATGAVAGKIGAPVVGGTLGNLTLNADGGFTYVVNQVGAQSLGQGSLSNDNFSYTVQDSKGNRATGILTVQVNGANDAPVAPVVPNQTFIANQFKIFTIPGFSDPENNSITYSLTQAGGAALPAWMFGFGQTWSGSPTNADLGPLLLEAKGTDSFGLSTTSTFTLTVVSSTFSILGLDKAKAEGAAGSTPFAFSVTRTGDLSGSQTVNWAVSGSGLSPANGADFVGAALPTGSVTFNAGETSKTLIIDVNGDATPEGNDLFTVSLTPGSANTGLGTSSVQAAIVDDDTQSPPTNAVLFGAPTPGLGYELWGSNLTPGGTVLVQDIHPGLRGSYPNSFRASDPTAFGHGVLFAATDNTRGAELWFSDGTAAGTRLVVDTNPQIPGAGLNPRYMTRIGGKAFFTGFNALGTARELWITDGTAAGTRMVKDINPGYGRSSPQQLTAFNDRLLFNAYDPTAGRELWISDGTDAGTTRVRDINTGSNASFPFSPSYSPPLLPDDESGRIPFPQR